MCVDYDNLSNLLCELFDGLLVIFIINDYYKDERETTYYMCIRLTNEILYNNPDYSLYKNSIEQECKRLNIKYKTPDIHNIIVKS